MEKLPPDPQEVVRDFARSLVEKKAKPKRRKLRLIWAGGAQRVPDQYSSLDNQKKSLECWGD